MTVFAPAVPVSSIVQCPPTGRSWIAASPPTSRPLKAGGMSNINRVAVEGTGDVTRELRTRRHRARAARSLVDRERVEVELVADLGRVCSGMQRERSRWSARDAVEQVDGTGCAGTGVLLDRAERPDREPRHGLADPGSAEAVGTIELERAVGQCELVAGEGAGQAHRDRARVDRQRLGRLVVLGDQLGDHRHLERGRGEGVDHVDGGGLIDLDVLRRRRTARTAGLGLGEGAGGAPRTPAR